LPSELQNKLEFESTRSKIANIQFGEEIKSWIRNTVSSAVVTEE